MMMMMMMLMLMMLGGFGALMRIDCILLIHLNQHILLPHP